MKTYTIITICDHSFCLTSFRLLTHMLLYSLPFHDDQEHVAKITRL